MNRLDEIKERMKIPTNDYADSGEMFHDIEYLFSIIQLAEDALENISNFCNDDIDAAIADEALEKIRGERKVK